MAKRGIPCLTYEGIFFVWDSDTNRYRKATLEDCGKTITSRGGQVTLACQRTVSDRIQARQRQKNTEQMKRAGYKPNAAVSKNSVEVEGCDLRNFQSFAVGSTRAAKKKYPGFTVGPDVYGYDGTSSMYRKLLVCDIGLKFQHPKGESSFTVDDWDKARDTLTANDVSGRYACGFGRDGKFKSAAQYADKHGFHAFVLNNRLYV
ncbi:MAG: hypothetical protein ACO37D_11835, partial [Rhodothermales bacterium]